MKKPKKHPRVTAPPPERAGLQATEPAPEDESLWETPFIQFLIIFVLGFALYFQTMTVPFIFDDYGCLVFNPVIKTLRCFPDTGAVLGWEIHPDLKNNLILRPLAYFTFALNYRLHGLGLFGYHLVNLLLHLGCALLLYFLVGELLKSPALAPVTAHKENRGVRYLPLFAALLFLCHPLQTQAVTYIVQRFVPLATFFYLAAIALYLRFRFAGRSWERHLSYLLALVATVLGMESKEIAFTLPVALLLLELMFFEGSLVPRLSRLIPFFLTMAIIPAKLLWLPEAVKPVQKAGVAGAINLINFGGISKWDYLMTQFGVIVTYLRLFFWPAGQTFDYDYPLQKTFFSPPVLLPLALLLALFGLACYLWARARTNRLYRVIAFGILWFFLTLSVESSLVPIDDLIFEHRAYLPSVGFFLALLAGIMVLAGRATGRAAALPRWVALALVASVAALSVATLARNRIWQNDIAFWKEGIAKAPKKSRPYLLYADALKRRAMVDASRDETVGGLAIMREGTDDELDQAVKAYREAIRLQPKVAPVHMKLAEALIMQRDFGAALAELDLALQLEPNATTPNMIRGQIFEQQGKPEEALKEYELARAKNPARPTAHVKLAEVYAKQGRTREAIAELELAIAVYPDDEVLRRLAKLKSGQIDYKPGR